MGIGDWGLGIGDWGLGPIPNPQSPSPNIIYKYILYKFKMKKENNSEQESSSSNFEYHEKEFWDNFYKNRNPYVPNINWYFDITKVKIDNFSLNNLSKEDEILIVGAGLSSILDYFNQNDYEKITIFDFSDELVKILTDKYSKDWAIDFYDIL